MKAVLVIDLPEKADINEIHWVGFMYKNIAVEIPCNRRILRPLPQKEAIKKSYMGR